MSLASSSFRCLRHSDSQNDVAFTSQCGRSSAITKSPNLNFANPLRVPASYHSSNQNHVLVARCAGAESPAVEKASLAQKFEDDSSGGGGDGSDFGGGGCGGGGGGGEDDGGGEEFGRLLKFEEVMKEAENRGVSLPADMWEAAKSTGIREVILFRYLDLQVYLPFSLVD